MPIGITRLNARHQQPNTLITFIKPLPGPNSPFAQDFLERIAAICHPIMKANHLSLMTLEEYEPNPEFVGRNFNAGEIVQLVLRARDGSWLSFRSVQMVMMHELAHCMQMNHSGAFWKVRNQYAEELRGLWTKGYTGDGFWGRGKTVLSERYENTAPTAPQFMPRSLCGGTFRSRRRKRKRKDDGSGQTSTYAERQQKRIAKKFGANGMALGADEETRVKLEDGQKVKAKPRVAGSNRGRELRAAAALARFGEQKKEEEISKSEAEVESDSETDDDYEAADEGKEAVNLDGSRMLDGKGNGLVRICEDEDQDDVDVKQEMQELQDLEQNELSSQSPSFHALSKASGPRGEPPVEHDDESARPGSSSPNTMIPTLSAVPTSGSASNSGRNTQANVDESRELACPICSMANDLSAVTCVVCSHVLDLAKVPGYWRCKSSACAGSQYVNVADCALCGVCGARTPN